MVRGPDLGRIYWIGGSPCAGKSTVSRLPADGRPAYGGLARLGTCERLAMPPEWQADREIDFYREQFDYVLEELAELPRSSTLVVERADLLPELLAAHGVPLERSIWMVPTPAFQLERYGEREWARSYVAGCPEPELAFANWMRRDMILADYVRRTATARGGVVCGNGLKAARVVQQSARGRAHYSSLGSARCGAVSGRYASRSAHSRASSPYAASPISSVSSGA